MLNSSTKNSWKLSVKNQLTAIWSRRDLIVHHADSLNKSRFAQTWLGPLWWLLQPIVHMFTFVFIFQIIFRTDIEGYPVYLLTGLVPWQWFTMSLSRNTTVIVNFMQLITQVRFPTISLVIADMLHTLYNFFIGFLLVIIFSYFYQYRPGGALLFLPLVLIAQFLLTSGLSILVASLGVFFRDMKSIVDAALPFVFYLSPAVYEISLVPERLRPIYNLNPFATIFTAYRDIILRNTAPDVLALLIIIVFGLLINLVALTVYDRSEPFFSRNI